jgi:hypothetical protein
MKAVFMSIDSMDKDEEYGPKLYQLKFKLIDTYLPLWHHINRYLIREYYE